MINRIIRITSLAILFFLVQGCTKLPENKIDLYQRSMMIQNKTAEESVLAKAVLKQSKDPGVNHIKILHLSGTPYEMGFQHGRLLKQDVRACINHIMKIAALYASTDIMDEIYDLMEPYIPVAEKEEMRGLAHGAGLPLRLVHWIHAIPAVSEYKYKKRFFKQFKSTSCSNIMAFGNASKNSEMVQMRVLDWNRRLGAQKWPVILVHKPYVGNASITFSFAGFIGCVSGMNEKHMAFGEMGYGNPDGETLEGIPFVFLFRKLMREANSLEDAVKIIKNAKRTCSYVYLISDAKKNKNQVNGLIFITDRQRVITFKENTILEDERDDDIYPALDDVLYAGAKSRELYQALKKNYGSISAPVLMEISKKVSLKGNIQNVIFKPQTLETWSSYAANDKMDEQGKACNQKWLYFNFKSHLESYR